MTESIQYPEFPPVPDLASLANSQEFYGSCVNLWNMVREDIRIRTKFSNEYGFGCIRYPYDAWKGLNTYYQLLLLWESLEYD